MGERMCLCVLVCVCVRLVELARLQARVRGQNYNHFYSFGQVAIFAREQGLLPRENAVTPWAVTQGPAQPLQTFVPRYGKGAPLVTAVHICSPPHC